MRQMAKFPLEITFLVSGMPFDGDTLKTKSLGGSESAGYYMARAMAKLGNRVKVFSNIGHVQERDGVAYMPLSQWANFVAAVPSDVHVVQRLPEAMAQRISTKLNVLWCHDLAHRRSANIMRAAKWQTDLTVVLSEFQRQQYKDVVGYEDDELWVSRNGFDFAAQPPVSGFDGRDHDLFVYAARPERGLDRLLRDVFPRLLKLRPNAKLAICTYDNPVDHLAGFYAECDALAAQLPVTKLGALTKPQLYDLFSRAAAYLYPCPSTQATEFREISCIAAIEAQACGLPFLSFGGGALNETVAQVEMGGVSLTIADQDDELARMAANVATDAGLFDRIQEAGLAHVLPHYSWDTIAKEWDAKFREEIAKRNASPFTLAKHFYRLSEIEGAKIALEEVGQDDPQRPLADHLRATIAAEYAWMDDHDAMEDHYAENLGPETLADLQSRAEVFTTEVVSNSGEPRFHFLRDAIKAGGFKHVLDWGCGHGWSPLYLAAQCGVAVTGYDLDPGAVTWARDLRDKTLPDKGVLFFDDISKVRIALKDEKRPPVDCVVISEVLEHVVDPVDVLNMVETMVGPGVQVFITTPLGPWEYGGPNWVRKGKRCHIRYLLPTDFKEMVGHKAKFATGTIQMAHHVGTNDVLGFVIAQYVTGGAPAKCRDLVRLMRLQRPRQTLAVNVIAGPGAELTMRWMLDSVKMIADEIVIGDTGMSPAALAICHEYAESTDYLLKIIKAPKPLEDGFDAARNAVLDASVADWVLWIDTDERLVEPHETTKFLRQNNAAGYGMQQVHVAVDDTIKPDTPVRLFRRNSGNRFHGMVHEHPETDWNKGPGMVCILGGFPKLWHIGYQSNRVRSERFLRNRPLLLRDREKNPQRALGVFLDCRDNVLLMGEVLHRSGGQRVPEVIHYAERVVALADEFAAMGVTLQDIDPTGYKSEALRVLGRGIEVNLDIRINRDGVGDPISPNAIRFADEKELRAFMDRVVTGKIEPLSGPFW
ncbi:MAG: methyltransferase domain-containing protein [Synechococcaceae cyanobacterium SM1_2_3]|nr:methyltransferase domain-containing protein [Synechococcaceae cyanobacterium SM1_2_3]